MFMYKKYLNNFFILNKKKFNLFKLNFLKVFFFKNYKYLFFFKENKNYFKIVIYKNNIFLYKFLLIFLLFI